MQNSNVENLHFTTQVLKSIDKVFLKHSRFNFAYRKLPHISPSAYKPPPPPGYRLTYIHANKKFFRFLAYKPIRI